MYRVLFIEADFYMRVDLDDQLAPHGFQITTVKDVRTALVKLKGQLFQAIMISYEDEADDVLSLLTTLRDAGNMIPVLLIAKRPTQEHLAAFLRFGGIEVVVKPFAQHNLVKRLKALILQGEK